MKPTATSTGDSTAAGPCCTTGPLRSTATWPHGSVRRPPVRGTRYRARRRQRVRPRTDTVTTDHDRRRRRRGCGWIYRLRCSKCSIRISTSPTGARMHPTQDIKFSQRPSVHALLCAVGGSAQPALLHCSPLASLVQLWQVKLCFCLLLPWRQLLPVLSVGFHDMPTRAHA